MRMYFETSAINYLADKVFPKTEFSSIATKQFQLNKGVKWQISNVALWEIFLTKDADRRYYLFDLSRHLFYDYLITSPEEVIIRYIERGCPYIEERYELNSSGLFSKEWKRSCIDSDYFFEPDRVQFESYTVHLRNLSRYFSRDITGRKLVLYSSIDDFSERINSSFLKGQYERLVKLRSGVDNDYGRFLTISFQIVLLVLCFGIGFDQPTIENFWNKEGKTEPLERLSLSISNFPSIFFRGPIANIAKMYLVQSHRKLGRGVHFDSLQAIYVTYSDLFVTNDQHFVNFKEHNDNDPNMLKILSIQDMEFFKV